MNIYWLERNRTEYSEIWTKFKWFVFVSIRALSLHVFKFKLIVHMYKARPRTNTRNTACGALCGCEHNSNIIIACEMLVLLSWMAWHSWLCCSHNHLSVCCRIHFRTSIHIKIFVEFCAPKKYGSNRFLFQTVIKINWRIENVLRWRNEVVNGK